MAVFTNQATLSYNDNVRNSNIVTGEIVEVLSATKTAVQDTYSDGDTVTYVVNLVNTGTTDYNGLTVTDNLGSYTVPDGTGNAVPLEYVDGSVRYFSNGTPQGTPNVTDAQQLEITGINVPAGGNATVIYSARINEFAPLAADGSITNTVTATGAGLTAPITAEAVITPEPEPDLTITKSVNPSTVAANTPLTYTFVISNTGNTAAESDDNLAVTDTFDPILNITRVALDGVELTSPADYTYDTATGQFSTTPGRITVPAAAYTQDSTTGEVSIEPGASTLTVTGTVQ